MAEYLEISPQPIYCSSEHSMQVQYAEPTLAKSVFLFVPTTFTHKGCWPKWEDERVKRVVRKRKRLWVAWRQNHSNMPWFFEFSQFSLRTKKLFQSIRRSFETKVLADKSGSSLAAD
eukprot:GHVN01022508.1.p1 GENE.GHVN01022508.1~~GHVN01022508.1.p1  ORF type:complete len:117 (+),score=5.67 GHVN01022508.1:99-449(+)